MDKIDRLLGKDPCSPEYWEGWERLGSMLRRDAEIVEWCAGEVMRRAAEGKDPACECAARLAAAVDRIGRLLGRGRVRIEATDLIGEFGGDDGWD